MTRQSLEFLYELLCNTQISVGHPDFDGRIELIVTAKRELEEELAPQLSQLSHLPPTESEGG